MLKIGNAQAFWGDQPDAAARLVAQHPDLDYLTMDYLAEVSMSIMAIQRDHDAALGYARDVVEVITSLVTHWKAGSNVKVITNAGGLNPQGCAGAIAQALQEHGVSKKIGVVSGDDVLEVINKDPDNALYNNMETGQALSDLGEGLVTANAYFGAAPIVDALAQGADIVITGRVADPSLTVAPCIHHYGWSFDDTDAIAGATVAGHLIECGTQVTGGFSTHWMDLDAPADIGFPVAEVSSDGAVVITKAEQSGGLVDERCVKEQLLYEIGDPDSYISPDAVVSFLGLQVEEVGKDRVRVSGATGRPPPATLKVSATWRDGYRADGHLVVVGAEAAKKARRCGEVILQRLQAAGCQPQRSVVEVLGTGDTVGGAVRCPEELYECVVHVAVADADKEKVRRFTKEVAPLVTSGPQGVTGYATGRPPVRQVFGFWPCLIDAKNVTPTVTIVEV